MQKIIPFKKETNFKDNVSEITSISLEHTLHKEENNLITGEFLVSGNYKVVETSSVIDSFSFRFPFDIHLDEKYDLEKVQIDIDDFYYEIKNDKFLIVNIDVLLDKIEEKKVKEEIKEVVIERSKLEEDNTKKDYYNDNIENVDNNTIELHNDISENIITELERNKCKDDIINPVKIIDTNKELIIEEEGKTNTEEIKNERIADDNMKNEIVNVFDNFDNNRESAIYKVYIVREEDTIFSITERYGISKETLQKYNDLKEVKKGDKLIIPCE